ncbi:MAG: pyruvate dehydrogenase complex E1 component subunit beta [Bacteroidia bacterium]
MAVMQMREALRMALREEMHRDATVFLMGEEVAQYDGAYKVSEGLLAEFGPQRVIDTPISELGFAAIGVGAAMVGLRPVIEFMTFNFALLAIDQVVNHAAKMLHMSGGQFGMPIVFRGPSGSAGQLAQQHSQSFENWYANVPGLKVVSPSTPKDAKGLLKAAIRDDDPVIVMESEILYNLKGEVPEDPEFLIPIGKADIKKEGQDVSLISFGKMVHVALEAAELLAKEGIQAEVIDLRTLRPIDYEALVRSICKTHRAVVVEESWPVGGLAGEITYALQKWAFDELDAPILRVTAADTPMAYAPTLVKAYLPSPEKVYQAAKEVLYL